MTMATMATRSSFILFSSFLFPFLVSGLKHVAMKFRRINTLYLTALALVLYEIMSAHFCLIPNWFESGICDDYIYIQSLVPHALITTPGATNTHCLMPLSEVLKTSLDSLITPTFYKYSKSTISSH